MCLQFVSVLRTIATSFRPYMQADYGTGMLTHQYDYRSELLILRPIFCGWSEAQPG